MMPPATPLTISRLRPLLQRVFPHAVTSPTITPLAADASTRRYFRLCWEPSATPALPSCIMMVRAPWPAIETPDFLTVGRHLQAHGVRVPEVYGIDPAEGLMCLEDYGDRTLAVHWQDAAASERLPWGRRAIDELVKMHTRVTRHDEASCPAFGLAFDVPKLLSELQFFRQHAIEGLWAHALTAPERAALDEAFEALCTILASAPRYFCHRDYHGWNIMVRAGAVGVLDFQDARMGPQPYDLVSLLVDRGTIHMLGDDVATALIDYYLDRMQAEEGRVTHREAFMWLFDHVAVQRCLKATGTFAAMCVLYQRPQYLPYIPPTLAFVRSLMQRYDTLKPLAALLHRYLPA